MSNIGNEFRNAIVQYIQQWNEKENLGINIVIEKPVGLRFVNTPRKIDIVLHKSGKFMGIEAKYQGSSGTAYQKLIYTLEDCKSSPIPTIIVFSGEGIKDDIKSKLVMSGIGIEVKFENGKIIENPPLLLQRICIELGINWLNFI